MGGLDDGIPVFNKGTTRRCNDCGGTELLPTCLRSREKLLCADCLEEALDKVTAALREAGEDVTALKRRTYVAPAGMFSSALTDIPELLAEIALQAVAMDKLTADRDAKNKVVGEFIAEIEENGGHHHPDELLEMIRPAFTPPTKEK